MPRLTLMSQYFVYLISGLFRDANGNQFFGVKLAFDLLAAHVLYLEHWTSGSVHEFTYFEYLGGVILFSAFREFHLLLAEAYMLAHPKF